MLKNGSYPLITYKLVSTRTAFGAGNQRKISDAKGYLLLT